MKIISTSPVRHWINQIGLILLLAFTCINCYKPSDYAPYKYVSKENVILGSSTQAITGQLFANSQSVVRLFVRLNPDADLTTSQITFKTVYGVFTGNDSSQITITPIRVIGQNQGNEAVTCWADLRAPLQADSVVVRASVQGYAEFIGVRFVRAFPDSINIDQGKTFAISSGFDSVLQLTAGVFRNRSITDKPSLGTKVRFSAFVVESPKKFGNSIGQFLPEDGIGYSDDKATASVAFTLGVTDYKKTVAIIAQTIGKMASRNVAGEIIRNEKKEIVYVDKPLADTVYYAIK